MTPILLTGPLVEPVTLADIKGYLRLDGNDEDRLINSLMAAARMLVEAKSGRCLIAQTWRLVFNRWPAGGAIRVPLSPVIRIVEARVYDLDGEAITVPPSHFHLDTLADPARIIMAGPMPLPGRAYGGIEIDLRVGFGETAAEVPMPLRQAVRAIVARWFENRGDDPEYVPAIPREVLALIDPFKRMRL
ncbi:head-tail connector protein [Pseudochelatococcus sp. G4_1912]|uniref:head-tail connector protein n=1 Tax=Pseudochelatococcus sp. G4_1912 TaxID=3114288 RepID=UPI0039C61860